MIEVDEEELKDNPDAFQGAWIPGDVVIDIEKPEDR